MNYHILILIFCDSYLKDTFQVQFTAILTAFIIRKLLPMKLWQAMLPDP